MFDYPKEAAVTMSEEYHAALVCGKAARHFIADAIKALNELDRIKKALFYGREYMHLMNGVSLFGGSEMLTAGFETPKQGEHVLHGILGVATEAGELLELWRDTNNGEKPFDLVNLKEEIGDLFWYAALLAREAGLTFDEIERANIAKLRTRYPNKFTEYDANNRNLEEEKKSLCGFLGEK